MAQMDRSTAQHSPTQPQLTTHQRVGDWLRRARAPWRPVGMDQCIESIGERAQYRRTRPPRRIIIESLEGQLQERERESNNDSVAITENKQSAGVIPRKAQASRPTKWLARMETIAIKLSRGCEFTSPTWNNAHRHRGDGKE